MLVEKINENKLEVVLNIKDLKTHNIDLQTFMSNSIENQNLFFEILNFANKNIGFNFKNCKFSTETFAIPTKKAFIIIINRITTLQILHKSKKAYTKLKLSTSLVCKFSCFENFCMFCNSLNGNIKIKSDLYFLDKNYYLFLKFYHLRNIKPILLYASEFSEIVHNNLNLKNYKIIIGNNAIEISKKYFI